ncbi:MAG: hypothetical protein H6712_20280 [Myxococcales bacterium]|nr:hypothetical protein [Myxococcales bacterium]MCB9716215.1 hypothetical protein [Myxococcales bacterium]
MPRRATLLLASLLTLASVGGCASRYKLDAEPPTYAAQAKIKVKTDKTGVRVMTMTVEHLAPPARIDPALRNYTVWISVPGHGVTKAGVLDYSERRRRGDLMVTSPYPKFEVLVTLESNPSTAQPGEQVILRKVVASS